MELQRSISSIDVATSEIIRDSIDRDVTIPADQDRHRFLLTSPRYTFLFPAFSRLNKDLCEYIFTALVNIALENELENNRSLNWCKIFPKFIPINTLGDGNCLMHAASLGMWGIHDRRLTLRKTVYQVLIEDQTGVYRKRWQSEVERQLEGQNGGSLMDIGIEQWSEDWKKTVALASTAKSIKNHSFHSLEEIHIFALANVLRRPILVICDNFHRGDYDEPIAGVNLGGIYLPLLSDSVDCIKTPLLIGYHHGHFTALVMAENNERGHALDNHKLVMGVPLTKYDGQPMKLHSLLPEESNYSDRLLREYLNCLKLDYTDENGCIMEILVAKMEAFEQDPHLDRMLKRYFKSMEHIYLETLAMKQLSLNDQSTITSYSTHHEDHFKNSKEHKPCAKINCRNIASAESNYCHQCRNTDNTRICTSPGCGYTANPDYEGLCSTCFTKLHALLEEGPHMVTPSAPPNDRCYNNCVNRANVNLHGLCYDCYKEIYNIHQITKNHVEPFSSTINYNTIERTINNGTEDDKTFEQVHASVPTQPAVSRSNSGYVLPNSQLNGPDMENKTCTFFNCDKMAMTNKRQLCYQHYLHLSRQKSVPHVEAVKTRCLTEECQFFGIPENDNLCSQCYAKALQLEYDLESEKKIKAEQERARRNWQIAQQQKNTNHDFNRLHYVNEPHYYQPIVGRQSISAPSSPAKRRPSKLIPCVTKGCGCFGTEEDQGLCHKCLKKKEMLLSE
ncbi:tumor necrosis factor alpha-induced protein 3-like isoform X2 [Xenia sp. Carnegie-2017]|uniref:tumor necrosis factor alpha-induced protein 3-like isoform X2 n=1 Tax=Xenia sp. Carnegie-2017 TaxID=2897299 RepID=UPI001F038987|nr:tumor necrosis factor alpha-induced protein 3-like isoform X2 [Xenia sp. Carnegie-2017]